MTSATSWQWETREVPLAPAAALALNGAVSKLAWATVRLRRHGVELRASVGPGHLLVLGDADDLPWADGVTYLGWVSGLLAPTTIGMSVHPDLLAQALRQRFGPGAFAVVPGQVIAYALSPGSVDADWLERYVPESAQ